jgi:peptidoglycan-associated lipoprotein
MARAILAFLTLLLLLTAPSCGSARKSVPEPKAHDRATSQDSDSDNAFGLQTIHFPARSMVVEPEERAKLAKNAEILKLRPKIRVELEGHTDGRGKMDMSLQLAETRAKVVREVLIGLGVDGSRMTTISYGKDRMLDHSGTEEAYARNRRVNFRVVRY